MKQSLHLIEALLFFFLSTLPLGSNAGGSEIKTPTNSGVFILNSSNFDSHLRDGKVWLVEFYAPWYVLLSPDVTTPLETSC